jgi:hypothetical protein
MNSLQKQSCLTITMATLSVIAYVALFPFLGYGPAVGAFGLFGIIGVGPLIWKKERLDERDHAIARRAGLISFTFSYLVFVLGCMGAWAVVYLVESRNLVSIHLLALITGAGGFTAFLAHAIATLILYRGTTEADHG